ncbi:leucine-rich repeat and immunoglobulin-like domain-containing nogo receptor-interacting protein 2 isoform X2 [Mizuhopecten yessoensis]|uniref:leucine-rich repeat and immunoglobulin-like domain-containing nogo receptor-interacting protein 2 isoform X2 n=1 Tax=Mizuhopecten yessoensis TaxID=6573 RepID=UPI000B45F12B|nr:leucine-rich repeat and immunoglobulin-like domain-containing nogo receptor-interacting protein 2 isoform X2 [Mizuhopecten yessoensis]
MTTISKFGRTLLVVLFLLCDFISGQSFPSGCAYSSTTGIPGIFTCDFTTVTLPLTFNTFSSPYPQRLVINNVDGQLPASSPSASFSGFSSMSTANLDTNFPASLEIKCVSNGNLLLFAGTFSGLSYMQELKITNCILSGGLPNNVFSDFGDLDSLIIDGGSINGLNADSLSGLNITKLSIPNALGMFAMMNLALNTNTFPSGFFYPLSKVKAIILDNLSTSSAMSLPTDTFTQNTNVETLSLSHSSLTSLENNVLSSLGALNYLNLTGVKWACTCDSLWILSTISTESINAIGGPVCDTPSDYQDKRATTYYYNMCPQDDACRGTPGVVLGGECITYAMLFGDGGANVAILIISCAILISVLKTRRAVKEHPREVTSINISTRGYRYSRDKKEAEAKSTEEPSGLRWV